MKPIIDPLFIKSLLAPERVFVSDIPDKFSALEMLSISFMKVLPYTTTEDLFADFKKREIEASSGIGHGIAIPHLRIPNLTKSIGALIVNKHRVMFDSFDKEPVDIFFGLIGPQNPPEHHLAVLAQVAMFFNIPHLCEKLRDANTNAELFDVIENLEELNHEQN